MSIDVEVKKATIEDVVGALDVAELEAIMADMVADGDELAKDPEVLAAYEAKKSELVGAQFTRVILEMERKEDTGGKMSKEEELVALFAEVKALREQLSARAKGRTVVVRGGRRYRLLKDDVSWCDTPQVHALVGIIKGVMQVGGDPVNEAAIVARVIAEESKLCTKQGGKKIWDYYKGDSGKGLVAHGNLERL